LANQQSSVGTLSYGTVQAGRVLTPEGAAPATVPPVPSGLTIEAAAAGFVVTWSGSAESQLPADFARLVIHASKIAGYTPTPGTEVNTITSPNGGIATTDADPGDTYYVRCGIASLRGTLGGFTPEAPVVPSSPAGGTQTFRQATAPGSAAEGDLWQDSDDGNKLYRWESGAWVAVEFGGPALAADALIGKVIATAASGRRIAITSTDPPPNFLPGFDTHAIYFEEDVGADAFPVIVSSFAPVLERLTMRLSGAIPAGGATPTPEVQLETQWVEGGGTPKGVIYLNADSVRARTDPYGAGVSGAGYDADQVNGLLLYGGTGAPPLGGIAPIQLDTSNLLTIKSDGSWGDLTVDATGRADIAQPFTYRTMDAQTFSSSSSFSSVAAFTDVETDGVTYSAGVFTVVEPGRYLVAARISFAANATGRRALEARRNTDRIAVDIDDATTAGNSWIDIYTEERFAAGDTVDLRAWQNSGASLAIDTGAGHSTFKMRRIGA
jgi:hypothetical protein